ncbi:cytochrome P450 [Mycobacterium sp. C31M]
MTESPPLAPRNPLSLRRQIKALRTFSTGFEELRDAGGPVTRLKLAPRWLMPELVVATSPQGGRDILGQSAEVVDKTDVHREMRHVLGANLFDLMHDEWLPRRRAVQPVFTKKQVGSFGGHMAQAAQSVVDGWVEGQRIDLDVECRRLTMRALGRSVLGIDLDDRADAIDRPLRVVLTYIADRASTPIRSPRWLPTPARGRARAAGVILHELADDVLQACRRDPTLDAPLVRALLAATDPDTGKPLTDNEIRDELLVFIAAGHDTTATTLTYALWQLGRNPRIQERVRDEVADLGDREPTPDDVGRLGYTVQVLREALRLCPPAAGTSRTALQDMIVDGHRVEAGTTLLFGIYAVQRDPDLWDRPLIFDPDRFGPEVAKTINRWQYLPFGAGSRSCIGDHFAMLEATLALATIVRGTEVRSESPQFPTATPFTMVAAAPIWAQVTWRRQTTEYPAGSAARPVSVSSSCSP